MKQTYFALTSLAAVLALAVFAAGCGEDVVSKTDVEQSVMTQLSASVGQQAPPITCPGDLEAKVGATLTCAIDLEGKTFDVNVEVTKLEDGKAVYDVEVASEPRP